MLLRLVGPFARCDDRWLENTSTGGLKTVAAAFARLGYRRQKY